MEELEHRQVKVYNPFTEEGDIIKKYGKEEYYKGPIYWQMARDIWTKDIGAVKRCDIIVAWMPHKKCIGTSAEVATAYEYKKFVQIISPLKHPSFSVYADQFYLTIDDWIHFNTYEWEVYK